jgi:hypothetical protein
MAICCGPRGYGCPDKVRIYEQGERKRCGRCQTLFEEGKDGREGKDSRDVIRGGPPREVQLAQMRREGERRRAMR